MRITCLIRGSGCRLTIDLFAKSNGVIVKVGDASHPFGVEVIVHYPDWAERNERLLEDVRSLLRNGFCGKDYFRTLDYVT